MPDEKVAAPVAEDTEGMPEGDAPFKSSVVMDEGMAAPGPEAEVEAEAEAEETEDAKPKAETSDAEAGHDAEKADGEDEVTQILKKADQKDNVQKRIDQLTARLKSLEEENTQLKGQKAPETQDKEYTEPQLRAAMKKAIEDGDADLIFEIMDYRVKKSEKDLVKRYQDAEKQRLESVNRINQEWEKVRVDYSNAWKGDDDKEIYPGAKGDLDIMSGESVLYRVAKDLYNQRDEQGNYIYRVPGGQRMAVADALAAILRHRKTQPQDGKVKKLERTLAKEKRKKSLAGAGSMEEEVTPKAKSSQETLAEVIAERKKFQAERGK